MPLPCRSVRRAMKGDTVLIVDDETDISLILKLQLEDSGYQTVRARDGIEALECLNRQSFDLMLLDIKMPRMNGIQVLEHARRDYPDVSVVMMTAHGSEAIAVDAMKKGALDYIAKPFSTDEAVKKVERAIAFNRGRIENRRLQAELAREQQKVAAILEGLADILVAVDGQGLLMSVNRRAEEELGLSRSELIGMPVAKALRADIPAERLPCMVALRTAEVCRDVTYSLELDGRTVPVLSSAAPLKEADGRLLGSVEIIRDISRLKALEQEKEDFVSMLSHDLKSPITAIVGSIDLVREGRLGPVLPDQQEYLAAAVESCDEMVEMIDTLLDVHKFEAGKMAISFRTEEPLPVIQRLFARYQPAASRAQLELSLDAAGDLPMVAIDRGKISRVLGNLLSNAFKFTDEGGKIAMRASHVADVADIRALISRQLYREDELPPDGGYLLVTVSDSGCGIPSDALTMIFDRFAQARNRMLGKTRGTGLGLAFCRKVMDAHKGYIWAESSEGEGSRFHLLIPVAEIHPEGLEAAQGVGIRDGD